MRNRDKRYWQRTYNPHIGGDKRYVYVLCDHEATPKVDVIDTNTDTVTASINLNASYTWQKGIYRPYDQNSYVFGADGSNCRLTIIDSNPASGTFNTALVSDVALATSGNIISFGSPHRIEYDWVNDVFYSLSSDTKFAKLEVGYYAALPNDYELFSQHFEGPSTVFPYTNLHSINGTSFRIRKRGGKYGIELFPKQSLSTGILGNNFGNSVKINNLLYTHPVGSVTNVVKIVDFFNFNSAAIGSNITTATSDPRLLLVYDPVNDVLVRAVKNTASNNIFFLDGAKGGSPTYVGSDAKLTPGASETRSHDGVYSPYSGFIYISGNGAASPTTTGVNKIHVIDCSQTLANRNVASITVGECAPTVNMLNMGGTLWMNGLKSHEDINV